MIIDNWKEVNFVRLNVIFGLAYLDRETSSHRKEWKFLLDYLCGIRLKPISISFLNLFSYRQHDGFGEWFARIVRFVYFDRVLSEAEGCKVINIACQYSTLDYRTWWCSMELDSDRGS